MDTSLPSQQNLEPAATQPSSSSSASSSSTPPSLPQKYKKRWWVSLGVLGVLFIAGIVFWLWYVANPTILPVSYTGKTIAPSPTVSVKATTSATPAKIADAPDCAGLKKFADKTVGMSFCYPSDWGIASVVDVRHTSSDTGYRQSVVFSNNPFFTVGGMSDNWSTTMGSGVTCKDPDNSVTTVSGYNTDWHSTVQSADDAANPPDEIRSLTFSQPGMDATEVAADERGLCVRGHKVIHGSRYSIAFMSFGRDFSEAAGITTPELHKENPNVLFSVEQRAQYNALMMSIAAY